MYYKNLKRRTIRSYSQLLDSYGVEHGAATMRELREEGRCPSPLSVASSSDAGNDDDVEDTKNVDRNGDDNDDLAKVTREDKEETNLPELFNKKMNIAPSSPSLVSPPKPFASFVSPLRKPTNSPPFANCYSNKMDNKESPILPTDISLTSSEVDNYPGSKQKPWVIHVDCDHPERNLIFDIRFIPRLEHNGWAREAIDIRTRVGLGDEPCWAAWIDTNVSNEFEDRVIMVKGRSRSSEYDKIEQYHRKNKKGVDLSAVDQQIKDDLVKDTSRLSTYFRLVMPEHLKLDNTILSGDPDEIMMDSTGIKYKVAGEADSGEKFCIECKSMFVNWTVATKNSGHKIRGFGKKSNYISAFD